MSLLNSCKQFFFNLPAWRSSVPILVIESDDWGSIRMSSSDSYDLLREQGYSIEKKYHEFDALENSEDIEKLFQILMSFQDVKGNHACITMNYLAANPDFDKIEENNFLKYFRKSLNEVYLQYDSETVVDLVKTGENKGVFDVQFHGTEHLQITRWMKALQEGYKPVCDAFTLQVFSPPVEKLMNYPREFMDALDYDSVDEIPFQIQSLAEGLRIFEETWKKKPVSFIAPCYRWSKPIEKFLYQQGIRFIQGQRAQLHPIDKSGYEQRKIYRYTGQRNHYGQIYTVRNVMFEPTLDGVNESLIKAKKQIATAFKWRLPAIVSSHRINYTSRLHKSNRDNGLAALKELLHWVKENYPNVEFLSSPSLGQRIAPN